MLHAATLDRRRLIGGGFAALGLAGCATQSRSPSVYQPVFAPIRASLNRLFDITVCLRPFRAQGPRLDTEQVGGKLVVHNYGHGGIGLVALLGLGACRARQGDAGEPEGDRRHRLRRARTHDRDRCAADGRAA